uniref:Uncharacterized protein n=1 Tax=Tanacetum cinerariifolium TaxID=118510 RepID=A0A6L2LQK0_TANCI|nr:hypothetical protein [Tanacetum cinerariifolium]
MRYVNTKPNGDALRKCILEGPYEISTITIPSQPTIDDSPPVEEQTVFETLSNMSSENKAQYDAEKEAIDLILTRIGDGIYSTIDACKTTHEMWIAIKRLQQEVYEIHVKKIATNVNPLALVAATQQYPDTYYQAPKSHKSYASTSKQSSSTRSHVSTRYKGKEIAKPITPPPESASEEDKQADWLEDTNEEVDKQELESHYMYMAKIQEVPTTDLGPSFDAEPLEENIEIELEKYKTYHNRTLEHDTLEEKHDELVKQSLLTKSRYEGLLKEKNTIIKDLKLKEENDLDKLIAMEKQLKFLNEIDINKISQFKQFIC